MTLRVILSSPHGGRVLFPRSFGLNAPCANCGDFLIPISPTNHNMNKTTQVAEALSATPYLRREAMEIAYRQSLG